VPADTLFLTPLMLDKVNWASQPSCGLAWQQAVTAALMPEMIDLGIRYAALKHRFPQILAAAGVNQAGKPQLVHANDKRVHSVLSSAFDVGACCQLNCHVSSSIQLC